MKKFLILLIIPAIIISIMLTTTTNVAYAQQQEGFDVRGDYKAEIVFGEFYLSNGRFLLSFSVTFDNDFLENLDEEQTLFDKDSLLNYVSAFITGIGFEVEIDEKGRIIGSQIYESITDYLINEEEERNGYEENSSNNNEEENTLFFKKSYSKRKTIFSGVEGNNDTIDFLLMQLNLHGLQSQDVAFGYHYGTPYKIITSDAEKSYYDVANRIYVHEFQMDINSADREILITQTSPNSVNWYLLAIGISIPFVIVPILIGFYLKRKEKQRREY